MRRSAGAGSGTRSPRISGCARASRFSSRWLSTCRRSSRSGACSRPASSNPDFARAVGWGFGDFVFGSAFDVVSDTTKVGLAGFTEAVDPADAPSLDDQIVPYAGQPPVSPSTAADASPVSPTSR